MLNSGFGERVLLLCATDSPADTATVWSRPVSCKEHDGNTAIVWSRPVPGKEHGGNTATVWSRPVSCIEHGGNTAAVWSRPVSGKEHGGNTPSLDTASVLQAVIIFCLLHIHNETPHSYERDLTVVHRSHSHRTGYFYFPAARAG